MSDRVTRSVPATLLLLALAPIAASAQDWRDVNSFRQRGSETRLEVELRYGAGKLMVEPGVAGELYRVGIRYDADVFDPLTEYRSGRLRVGVEGSGRNIRLRNQDVGHLNLALSPDIPLDLGLSFGAVEANIELGGLRVTRLKIETGASDSRVSFSEPNATDCQRIELSLGAAAFRAEGLANARCDRIKVDGGVGDINLDFTGEWTRDMAAEVNLALGSLTLIIPEDVGVLVRRSTFLTGFDARRFTREGRDHRSDNWDRATRRLTVDISGAFGSINVRWAAPTVATPSTEGRAP